MRVQRLRPHSQHEVGYKLVTLTTLVLFWQPNLAHFIQVGNSSIINFWAQTLSKVVGTAPIYVTPSVESALEVASNMIQVRGI